MSAVPANTATAGTTVTISASATCTSPSPSFEFWYFGQGASSWQLVKGYSTTASFMWNSTGAAAGAHKWSVWVHDANTTGQTCSTLGCYDNFGNLSPDYMITAPSCASVSAVGAPSGSQTAGTSIVVTATAGTCSNASPVFQFWYLGVGASGWQMVKDYSTTAVFTWNSTGALTGNHVFSVWIKDAKSSGAHAGLGSTYDAFTSPNVTVPITQPVCASVTLAAAPPSPIAHGTTTVVFTATAGTCSNAGPLYQFWYRGQGSSTWQMVKDYSTSPTFTWNTTGALAGNHYWSVWIKDAKSAGANAALGSTYDAFGPLTYVLT